MTDKMLSAAVDAWAAMHRDELVRDVIRLVNIPSVTGTPACSDAAEVFAQMAQAYGFAAEMDDGYSVSVRWPNEGARELGMLGHLDVVPEGDGWKHAPFDAVEKDGWIIGRGSSDNKGPVVMCLYVMRCLRELGIPLKSDIRLIAGLREETDMEDMRHYLTLHQPPAYTLNCDGAWAGCIGEKGILEADLVLRIADGNLLKVWGGTASNTVAENACALLSAADDEALDNARALCSDLTCERRADGVYLHMRGKAAHCCTPLQGDNAIVKLLRLLCSAKLLTGDAAVQISRLCECFPDHFGTGLRIHHEDGISGKTTCVCGLIGMDEHAVRANINVRSAVTQRYEPLMQALSKRLEKMNIALENVRWSPPRCDSPDAPEVKLLIDTCREFIDPRAKTYVMGGGTHSRVFPRSLPFGPGVMDPRRKNPFGGAHAADEAVLIDDLTRAMKAYAIALKRLDVFFES